MAQLTDLPSEVLELIYRALGSIDDVHHLIRTCRTTARVTCQRNVYLDIMRSVIHHSPQHRRDYQLNKILAVHARFVAFLSGKMTGVRATKHPSSGLNDLEVHLLRLLCLNPHKADWSDMEICDVLARYQGLRVLEDIWLSRQLEEQDYLSAGDASDHQEFSDRFITLVTRADEFAEGQIQRRHPKDKHTHSYKNMHPDQRARFYAAVVRIWFMNEVRWMLTNFDCTKLLLGPCQRMIKLYVQDGFLTERLDECAIFAFMYHHLLPRNIKFLADRDSSKLPFTFESDFRKDNVQCCRLLQACLTAAQAHFQPPDLIDLVIRSSLSRRPPYPEMTMPELSEAWRHPQSTDSPPNMDLFHKDMAPMALRVCIRHLQRIGRSSIHEDVNHLGRVQNMAQFWYNPLVPRLLDIPDWAMTYLVHGVICEFEKDKSCQEGLVDMKSVFEKKWKEVQWEVWWWANNDDKARMKMERWRQVQASIDPATTGRH
ncbi:hypothetical protein BM1_04363 [Bipolaris maydis]|nr:hypothetical protein BM1_04363 [Bipolaris maydis]